MLASLVLLCVAAVGGAPVETRWAQVGPVSQQAAPSERSPDRNCAVVLVQGLQPHPFSSRNVAKANWDSWQQPESQLVKMLAKEADVFAFAYGQNVALDEIAETDSLRDNVQRLKQLGYAEIVLVGHSAGGLVARQFVEDHPDAGVTKVIQVCAPNGGSCWGSASALVRQPQEEFLASLKKECRQECLTKRADKLIPESIEFVCLIGHIDIDTNLTASLPLGKGRLVSFTVAANAKGDGVVSSECQWPPELQAQGIPVVALNLAHSRIMHYPDGVETIALLVHEKRPRWTAKEVAEARKVLFESKSVQPQ